MENIYPTIKVGNPQNPGLLFLHGFLGSGLDWKHVVHRLSDSYYCVCPDLPGHGDNQEIDENITISSIGNQIANYSNKWFSSPPTVIGYSMGGRIAIDSVINHPKSFASVIIESSNPGIISKEDRTDRLQLDKERAREMGKLDLYEWLSNWYQMPLFASLNNNPSLRRKLISSRIQNDLVLVRKIIVELSPGKQPHLWDKLSTINMPTLLLAGELDAKYQNILSNMQKRIRPATLKVISGTGHNIHLESPDEFTAAIKSFLPNQ
jgi:2-succinyl-6-hydroxy-2,4-cyclohexadiene-1-carboxylate synthase